MKKAIVTYLPVIHRGYLEFFDANHPVDTIFLIDENTLKEIDGHMYGRLHRDLRSVPSHLMKKMLDSLCLFNHVLFLSKENLKDFDQIIVPEDDANEAVLSAWYPSLQTDLQNVFLRWSWKSVEQKNPAMPDDSISQTKFDNEIMLMALNVSMKSSDWWRNVGAVIIPLTGEPIEAFNHHLPHEQSPYINGDARSNFSPGESIEMCTAIHAEASAIAIASKKGIPLDGASIYVTTFPCPVCARLIAESGIKKVYYEKGYSRLDALELFRSQGIETILVLPDFG